MAMSIEVAVLDNARVKSEMPRSSQALLDFDPSVGPPLPDAVHQVPARRNSTLA